MQPKLHRPLPTAHQPQGTDGAPPALPWQPRFSALLSALLHLRMLIVRSLATSPRPEVSEERGRKGRGTQSFLSFPSRSYLSLVAAPKVTLCILHDKLCLDFVFCSHSEDNGYVENVIT